MLNEKRKRYIFSFAIFAFLCAGVVFALVLFQRNQDIRQQASTSCNPGDPYCVCNSSGVCEIVSDDSARQAVTSNSDLSNKGIVATNFTGDRATTESSCSGLWMNSFCYMEGDELAGGYVVTSSGDGKNYPHLVKEEVYDSAQFGSSGVKETLGSQANLGDNCGGKGLPINGTCYAYGSSVNGYVVMPNRSGNCNNDSGNYCYAHLKKIEVSYDDWNKAVAAYENDGNLTALENLYQSTYGILFDSGSLYDKNAGNVDALKAQAILAALTNSSVLKEKLQKENEALLAEGLDKGNNQALYDYNQEAIGVVDRDYYFDSLADGELNQIIVSNEINQAQEVLITASDSEISAKVTSLFKDIYGYEPSKNKYGDWQSILEDGLGLDINQIIAARDEYQKAEEERQRLAEEQAAQQVAQEAAQQSAQGNSQGGSMLVSTYEEALLEAAKNPNISMVDLVKTNPDLVYLFKNEFGQNYLNEIKGMSDSEVLRILGFSASEIKTIIAERSFNDSVNSAIVSYVNDDVASSTSLNSELRTLLEEKIGKAATDVMVYSALLRGENVNEVAMTRLMGQEMSTTVLTTKIANDSYKAFSRGDFSEFVSNCKKLNEEGCDDTESALETITRTLNPGYSDTDVVVAVEQELRKIADSGFAIEKTEKESATSTTLYPSAFPNTYTSYAANTTNIPGSVSNTQLYNNGQYGLIYQTNTKQISVDAPVFQNNLKKEFGIDSRSVADYVFANEDVFSEEYVSNVRLNDLLEDNLIFNTKNNRYDLSDYTFTEKLTAKVFQGLEGLHSSSTKNYVSVAVANSDSSAAEVAQYAWKRSTNWLRSEENKEGLDVNTSNMLYAASDLGGQIARDVAIISAPFAITTIGTGSLAQTLLVNSSAMNLDAAVSNMGSVCISGTEDNCKTAKKNVGIAAAQMVASTLAASSSLTTKATQQAAQGINSTINTVNVANGVATSNSLLNLTGTSSLLVQGTGLAAGGLATYQANQYRIEACDADPDGSECRNAKGNLVFAIANTSANAVFGFGESAYGAATGNSFSTGVRSFDKGLDIALAVSGGAMDAQSALNQCLMYDDYSSCVTAVITGVAGAGMDIESIKLRNAADNANRLASSAETNRLPDFDEDAFVQRISEDYHARLSAVDANSPDVDLLRSNNQDAQDQYDQMRSLVKINGEAEGLDAKIKEFMRDSPIDKIGEADEWVARKQELANQAEEIIANQKYDVDENLAQQQQSLLNKLRDQELAQQYDLVKDNVLKDAELFASLPKVEEAENFTKKAGLAGLTQSSDAKNRALEVVSLEQNLNKINELNRQLEPAVEIAKLDAEIDAIRDQGSISSDDQQRLNGLFTERDALSRTTDIGGKTALEIETEINALQKQVELSNPEKRNIFEKAVTAVFGGKTQKAQDQRLVALIDLDAKQKQLANLPDDATRTEKITLERQIDDLQTQVKQSKIDASNENITTKVTIVTRVQDAYDNAFGEGAKRRNLKNLASKLGTEQLDAAKAINAKQAEIDELTQKIADTNDDAEITKLKAELDLKTTELENLDNLAISSMKGENALIKGEINEDGFTEFRVTELGEKAKLKQSQLDLFNDEVRAFETQRRTLDSRFQNLYEKQYTYLIAELESYGSPDRGAIFNAPTGIGKTDVLMPLNVMLKQRMTGDSQFVVYPKSELTKPWTIGDNDYTPNDSFIKYVESRFGEGSVVIVRPNTDIDPALIRQAKFVITTKDVAFNLISPNTNTRVSLFNKWENSFIHADEVHWSFDPNEKYLISRDQTNLANSRSFSLYEQAQKNVLGIDASGNTVGDGLVSLTRLVNEAETNRAVPGGIRKNDGGQGGHLSDDVEKQVLTEWIAKNWTAEQQKTLSANPSDMDIVALRTEINKLTDTIAGEDITILRSELNTINKTIDLLASVPKNDYGLVDNNGILSIAPRENAKTTGRSYSSVSEQLIYNSVGAKILGVSGDIDINKITVGNGGDDINYAELMTKSKKGYSLWSGTPEVVANTFKIAFNVNLRTYSESTLNSTIARYKVAADVGQAQVANSVASQAFLRSDEDKNPVYVNMDMDQRSNDAVRSEVIESLSVIKVADGSSENKFKKMFVVGANGELIEGDIQSGKFVQTNSYRDTDALNVRTDELDDSGERYVKFYELGAHTGVDTRNNVDISRAIGICRNCDSTTFAQGINRIRVDNSGDVERFAPIDIIYLDASDNSKLNIDSFVESLNANQARNQAISEVQFKETLLRNSVNSTIADLVDLTKNGKNGFLGIGSYKKNADLSAQIESLQQRWKEVSEMSYRLGSDEMTAEQKLQRVVDQSVGTYKELADLVKGSGAPERLLVERAGSAIDDSNTRIAFADVETNDSYLGKTPSFSQVVDLINNTSRHLAESDIDFSQRGASQEVVQAELQNAVSESQRKVDVQTKTNELVAQSTPNKLGQIQNMANGARQSVLNMILYGRKEAFDEEEALADGEFGRIDIFDRIFATDEFKDRWSAATKEHNDVIVQNKKDYDLALQNAALEADVANGGKVANEVLNAINNEKKTKDEAANAKLVDIQNEVSKQVNQLVDQEILDAARKDYIENLLEQKNGGLSGFANTVTAGISNWILNFRDEKQIAQSSLNKLEEQINKLNGKQVRTEPEQVLLDTLKNEAEYLIEQYDLQSKEAGEVDINDLLKDEAETKDAEEKTTEETTDAEGKSIDELLDLEETETEKIEENQKQSDKNFIDRVVDFSKEVWSQVSSFFATRQEINEEKSIEDILDIDEDGKAVADGEGILSPIIDLEDKQWKFSYRKLLDFNLSKFRNSVFIFQRTGSILNPEKFETGQIFKKGDLYYRVFANEQGEKELREIAYFKQNIPSYKKTIESYVKENSPTSINLANNFQTEFYWDDANENIYMRVLKSGEIINLTQEKEVLFSNGLVVNLLGENELNVDFFTDNLKLSTGQSITVDKGQLYFDNHLYQDSNVSKFYYFKINDIFHEASEGKVKIKDKDKIFIRDGISYILEKDANGFWFLDDYLYNEYQKSTVEASKKVVEFIQSPTLRFDFLNYLKRNGILNSFEIDLDENELEKIANDYDQFEVLVKRITGFSTSDVIVGFGLNMNFSPETIYSLSKNQFTFAVFNFLMEQDNSFRDEINNSLMYYNQDYVDRMKFSLDRLKYESSTEGLNNTSQISYIKNLELIISLYESLLNDSPELVGSKIEDALSLFDKDVRQEVESQLNDLETFNPFYNQSVGFSHFSYPYNPSLRNNLSIDLISQKMLDLLKTKLFKQVVGEDGLTAFESHQKKTIDFWNDYFTKYDLARPTWFDLNIFTDKDEFVYSWQHSSRETTIANAAGYMFLAHNLSFDKDELEHVLDHEGVHNSYLSKSSPRKYRSAESFIYEEILTELISQMILAGKVELPSQNFKDTAYQGGVNELIAILDEIDKKAGKGKALELVLNGIVDYGEDKVDNPLYYVEDYYKSNVGLDKDDFRVRLSSYTDDILRTNRENYPEQASMVGKQGESIQEDLDLDAESKTTGDKPNKKTNIFDGLRFILEDLSTNFLSIFKKQDNLEEFNRRKAEEVIYKNLVEYFSIPPSVNRFSVLGIIIDRAELITDKSGKLIEIKLQDVYYPDGNRLTFRLYDEIYYGDNRDWSGVGSEVLFFVDPNSAELDIRSNNKNNSDNYVNYTSLLDNYSVFGENVFEKINSNYEENLFLSKTTQGKLNKSLSNSSSTFIHTILSQFLFVGQQDLLNLLFEADLEKLRILYAEYGFNLEDSIIALDLSGSLDFSRLESEEEVVLKREFFSLFIDLTKNENLPDEEINKTKKLVISMFNKGFHVSNINKYLSFVNKNSNIDLIRFSHEVFINSEPISYNESLYFSYICDFLEKNSDNDNINLVFDFLNKNDIDLNLISFYKFEKLLIFVNDLPSSELDIPVDQFLLSKVNEELFDFINDDNLEIPEELSGVVRQYLNENNLQSFEKSVYLSELFRFRKEGIVNEGKEIYRIKIIGDHELKFLSSFILNQNWDIGYDREKYYQNLNGLPFFKLLIEKVSFAGIVDINYHYIKNPNLEDLNLLNDSIDFFNENGIQIVDDYRYLTFILKNEKLAKDLAIWAKNEGIKLYTVVNYFPYFEENTSLAKEVLLFLKEKNSDYFFYEGVFSAFENFTNIDELKDFSDLLEEFNLPVNSFVYMKDFIENRELTVSIFRTINNIRDNPNGLDFTGDLFEISRKENIDILLNFLNENKNYSKYLYTSSVFKNLEDFKKEVVEETDEQNSQLFIINYLVAKDDYNSIIDGLNVDNPKIKYFLDKWGKDNKSIIVNLIKLSLVDGSFNKEKFLESFNMIVNEYDNPNSSYVSKKLIFLDSYSIKDTADEYFINRYESLINESSSEEDRKSVFKQLVKDGFERILIDSGSIELEKNLSKESDSLELSKINESRLLADFRNREIYRKFMDLNPNNVDYQTLSNMDEITEFIVPENSISQVGPNEVTLSILQTATFSDALLGDESLRQENALMSHVSETSLTDLGNIASRLPSYGNPHGTEINRIYLGDYKLFENGKMGPAHKLINIGIPSSDISAIVLNNKLEGILLSQKIQISRAGWYIPIFNQNGQILFTPDEFNEMRDILFPLEVNSYPEESIRLIWGYYSYLKNNQENLIDKKKWSLLSKFVTEISKKNKEAFARQDLLSVESKIDGIDLITLVSFLKSNDLNSKGLSWYEKASVSMILDLMRLSTNSKIADRYFNLFNSYQQGGVNSFLSSFEEIQLPYISSSLNVLDKTRERFLEEMGNVNSISTIASHFRSILGNITFASIRNSDNDINSYATDVDSIKELAFLITDSNRKVIKNIWEESFENIEQQGFDIGKLKEYRSVMVPIMTGSGGRSEVTLGSDLDYEIIINDDSFFEETNREEYIKELKSFVENMLSPEMNKIMTRLGIRADAGLGKVDQNGNKTPFSLISDIKNFKLEIGKNRQLVEPTEVLVYVPVYNADQEIINRAKKYLFENENNENYQDFVDNDLVFRDQKPFKNEFESLYKKLGSNQDLENIKSSLQRVVNFKLFSLVFQAEALGLIENPENIPSSTWNLVSYLEDISVLKKEEADLFTELLAISYRLRFISELQSTEAQSEKLLKVNNHAFKLEDLTVVERQRLFELLKEFNNKGIYIDAYRAKENL